MTTFMDMSRAHPNTIDEYGVMSGQSLQILSESPGKDLRWHAETGAATSQWTST